MTSKSKESTLATLAASLKNSDASGSSNKKSRNNWQLKPKLKLELRRNPRRFLQVKSSANKSLLKTTTALC